MTTPGWRVLAPALPAGAGGSQGSAEALVGFSCFGIEALPVRNGGLCPGQALCWVWHLPGGGLCVFLCSLSPGMLWGMGGGGWCPPCQSIGGMSLGRLWPDGCCDMALAGGEAGCGCHQAGRH